MSRWAAAAIVGLTTLYVLGAVTTYPSLFPDPAYGLLVDKSWRAGSPWNHATEPDAEDLARDATYFHTTWSPGQHAVPAVLLSAGMTPGDALRVVNIFLACVGLLGWYGLVRVLGFDRGIALGTCAIIAASRTFSFSFLTYTGSDQLAFAGFPYLAAAILRLRPHWVLALFVPAALGVGFFLKNSMAIYLTAWIAAVTVVPALRSRSARSLSLMAAVAVSGAAALWAIDSWYVSRGWTPVSYQPQWSVDPSVYLLPAAMPILAGTGLDGVLSRIFAHPSGPSIDYKRSLVFLLPIVAATVLWLLAELRRGDPIRQAVVTSVGLVVAVFTVLLATGSGASLDLSRHYVLPGLLLLPFLLERMRTCTSRMNAGLAVMLLVPALYGLASFGSNWWRQYQGREVHSDTVRLTHLTLTLSDLRDLTWLDRELPRLQGLAVLPIPALALEFAHARVLATSATSDGVADFARRPLRGQVPNLVVVVEPAGQTVEEVRAWLSSFQAYPPDRWSVVRRARLAYYVPEGQALDAAQLEAGLNSRHATHD